jgi:hypothetical protein
MRNRFLIVAVLSLLFMGCEDQLERLPIDELVEETAFQTVDDLQLGLNALIGNYNYETLIGFNSIFTDNCKIGLNSGGQEVNTLGQLLNPDFGDRGMWANRYGVINDINRVLAAAAGIAPGAAEVDQYNNILGQCYAFRALMHWELLLYYGLDVTNPTAAGVPYIDFVSADALPSRNTTEEVLNGIEADFTEANALLAGTSDINFATQDFIRFVRARIALETGDYQGAINIANSLIPNYPLATPGQYFNMFNEDADATEVIWRFDNVLGFNTNIAGLWIFTAGPSPLDSSFIEVSKELEQLLDPNDVRRLVILHPDTDLATNELLIGKYPPNADTQWINDFKAMRISEIHLIKAEAHARLNQLGPAAQSVNDVRSARFLTAVPPVSYTSQLEAIEGVIAERRLELAFEGHRYNDIKRVRDITNKGIERIDADCGDNSAGAPCLLPPNDERWVYPIPTAEINANPNIEQAPGYTNN